MEFSILDRIVAWVPGRWIRAEKCLGESEPYLRDHFPGTPVLPGVLILEGMVQAGRALVDLSEPGPRRRLAVDAFRGVKFMRFVQPGERLEICCQLMDFRKPEGPVEMLCQGEVAGRMVVSARIRLKVRNSNHGSAEETGTFKNREAVPFCASPQLVQLGSVQNESHGGEVFRWLWIDRFTQFQSGVWAEAYKEVPSASATSGLGRINPQGLSATFILEGMAQTGGLLVFDAVGFRLSPIMARIAQAEFYFEPRPGENLVYRASLDRHGPEGAAVTITSHQAEQLQAKAEILFALISNGADAQPRVDPAIFYRMMTELGAFDVPTPGRPIPLSNHTAAPY
ncbi:MAG: hypothetical protein NZ602_11655 [Thermoguttaceae bacterium]|nr:hypothetical protein [Thermoguttaceae bacterium]MDW8039155.1 hypothetical protein [Thermoguttaceae bacterium]